jgi:hypothetical protein
VRLSDFAVDPAATANFVWATTVAFGQAFTGTVFRRRAFNSTTESDYQFDASNALRIDHILFPEDFDATFSYTPASTQAAVLSSNPGLTFRDTPSFPSGSAFFQFTTLGGEGFASRPNISPTDSFTIYLNLTPMRDPGSGQFNTQLNTLIKNVATNAETYREILYIGGANQTYNRQGGWNTASPTVTDTVNDRRVKYFMSYDMATHTVRNSVFDSATNAVLVNDVVYTNSTPLFTASSYIGFSLTRNFKLYDFKIYSKALTGANIQRLASTIVAS